MSREIQRDSQGWMTSYDGHKVLRISELASCGSSWRCINLKGCNGSGKSTIPIWYIANWNHVYLTMAPEDKRPVATYIPRLNLVILGTYFTACGGCDSLGNTQIVKELLKLLWKKNVHIMFEGVIVGDIKSTFYEIMTAFRNVWNRELSFCFMGTPLAACFSRIQSRNGGKPINEALVRSKRKNSATHLRYYLEQGNVDCKVLDTSGPIIQVINRFAAMYPEFPALAEEQYAR